MTNCPCCSHVLLRQIRHHQVYWFCRNCWQEMPMLDREMTGLVTKPTVETSIPIRHSLMSL